MNEKSRKKLLFVCRANANRSKTAEAMYNFDGRYEVRSAGVDPKSFTANSKLLTEKDVSWADVIIAADDYVRGEIAGKFPDTGQRLVNIGIPDEYDASVPERRTLLKKLLLGKLTPVLGNPQNN